MYNGTMLIIYFMMLRNSKKAQYFSKTAQNYY